MISQEPAAPRVSPESLPPPLPPLSPPPTDIFRRLLATPPAEREQLLTNRPPAYRELLLRKARQYEAMPAERRELHLRTLELRYYLLGLVHATPSHRVASLAPLPAADRRIIANRLMYWDLLPSNLQKEVLANELAIRIVVPAESGVPFFSRPLTNLPPSQRQKLEADIAHWKSLPGDVQQQVYWHFCQLFKPPETPTVAKSTGPSASRPVTMETFKQLPEADRQGMLDGYRRYTELPPAARQNFMAVLKRWPTLSEEEREKWRQAAKKRPPPLPPVLPPSPPGLPVGTAWPPSPTTNRGG